ncbi:MAG: hypothetical protein JSR73_02590 [Proteobacteria bacterium]|nr:hypothetical protein [Pseudomonadota bacterium]
MLDRTHGLELRPAPTAALPRALYLHAGWRCGSTYIWSKFRALAGALCFYEPFHEQLARLTRRRIARATPGRWDSRHPPLAGSYLEEFRPFLWLRGVPHYAESFAAARYFADDELDPECTYLALLARQGAASGRLSVFGFSRSLGRAATLARRLPGLHVVIRRDPLQQWLSCRSYRVDAGHDYFELAHLLLLALARPGTPAARVARALGLPELAPGSLARQRAQLKRALRPWPEPLSYAAFVAVQRLSLAAAEPAADLVLDLETLGASERYRRHAEHTIARATGLAVDFRDCSIPRHPAPALPFDPAETGRAVARLVDAARSAALPGHPGRALG